MSGVCLRTNRLDIYIPKEERMGGHPVIFLHVSTKESLSKHQQGIEMRVAK